MQTDREIVQELIDEQLSASAVAGQLAHRIEGVDLRLVEIACMRRARVLASVLLHADDTRPAPERSRPRLVVSNSDPDAWKL